jgi:hypothetical protein
VRAVIPVSAAAGRASIQVSFNGAKSNPAPVTIVKSQLGLFGAGDLDLSNLSATVLTPMQDTAGFGVARLLARGRQSRTQRTGPAHRFRHSGGVPGRRPGERAPLLCRHRGWTGVESRRISSLGGILGGFLASALCLGYFTAKPRQALRYVDSNACVRWFSGVLCRLGCALAHDHVGVRASNWLAVQFPTGPRYDLGLLEFLVLLPSSLILAVLDRRGSFREAAPGSWFGWSAIGYGAFRFELGFLSGRPAVAWALTADQITAMLLVAVGSGVFVSRSIIA